MLHREYLQSTADCFHSQMKQHNRELQGEIHLHKVRQNREQS